MFVKRSSVLMIFIGIVIASYIVRNAVLTAMRMAYFQQQAFRAQQQRKQAAAKAKAKKEAPTPKTAKPQEGQAKETPSPSQAPRPVHAPRRGSSKPEPQSPYKGIWRGRTAIDGRGVCDLRLELTEQPDSPTRFTGYSTMTCSATGPLMPGGKINRRMLALDRMDPASAILTGLLAKESVELKVDKTIGADSQGCAPVSFSLTPFGRDELAAEWREATCSGGHVLMRKARR